MNLSSLPPATTSAFDPAHSRAPERSVWTLVGRMSQRLARGFVSVRLLLGRSFAAWTPLSSLPDCALRVTAPLRLLAAVPWHLGCPQRAPPQGGAPEACAVLSLLPPFSCPLIRPPFGQSSCWAAASFLPPALSVRTCVSQALASGALRAPPCASWLCPVPLHVGASQAPRSAR